MSTAALNNLWAYIQGMALSDSNKQWLADRLIESKTKKTTRDVARIICTEEEYQRLEAEGFLDNPQPQFGPFTEEEILRETEEAEKRGYVGIERSKQFMDSLLKI